MFHSNRSLATLLFIISPRPTWVLETQRTTNKYIPQNEKKKEGKGKWSLGQEMASSNRRRGPGTREKVSSRRINLEGNTHVLESNVSQLPV
jgi:hypothetical protein